MLASSLVSRLGLVEPELIIGHQAETLTAQAGLRHFGSEAWRTILRDSEGACDATGTGFDRRPGRLLTTIADDPHPTAAPVLRPNTLPVVDRGSSSL
jgi:hypothetical protein